MWWNARWDQGWKFLFFSSKIHVSAGGETKEEGEMSTAKTSINFTKNQRNFGKKRNFGDIFKKSPPVGKFLRNIICFCLFRRFFIDFVKKKFVPVTLALFIKTSMLNGGVNCGTIGSVVKLHSHNSDGGVRAWRVVISWQRDRVEAMGPASRAMGPASNDDDVGGLEQALVRSRQKW